MHLLDGFGDVDEYFEESHCWFSAGFPFSSILADSRGNPERP